MSLFSHILVTFKSLYKKGKNLLLVSFCVKLIIFSFGSVSGRGFHNTKIKTILVRNVFCPNLVMTQDNQRFRKGVGGRGLANKPPKPGKKFSRNMFPFLLRWHRKRVQKRGLNLWHRKNFSAPTPMSANPFSKLLR